MKRRFTVLAALLAGLLVAPAAQAQDQYNPNQPDTLLTKEHADIRIGIFRGRVDSLNRVSTDMKTRVTTLNTSLETETRNVRGCNDELLALLGATEADLANFRQRLGVIEGRVREMQRLENNVLADRRADVTTLENDLNAMRKERVAVLPEFYNKIIALAADIKGLYRTKEGTQGSYTVGTWAENRDCLWNIAGRAETYSDPFQWPKIWQANADQIRNPDIIHPGQVLQIPPAGPKTDEEMKAERRYFRQKRARSERGEATAPASGTQAQPR